MHFQEMTLLKDHIRSSKSDEEGLRAFTDDVAQRYPQLPLPSWEPKRQVACRWAIEYFSKTDTATTLLMLPLLLFGHFAMKRSQLHFVTFHYLTASEASRMRQAWILKKLLLPFVVFGLAIAGIAGFIGFCVLIVGLLSMFKPPNPEQPHPAMVVLFGILILLVLVAMIYTLVKAQRKVWKMGQPPHADEFRDQRVLLRSIEIT